MHGTSFLSPLNSSSLRNKEKEIREKKFSLTKVAPGDTLSSRPTKIHFSIAKFPVGQKGHKWFEKQNVVSSCRATEEQVEDHGII